MREGERGVEDAPCKMATGRRAGTRGSRDRLVDNVVRIVQNDPGLHAFCLFLRQIAEFFAENVFGN